ncbi:hypothetical protein B9Q01_09540 [Candidatus Marsarchaeota G1 archaeon OSP_D]|jgi:CRISPR-associated protein (Cas_Cmr3).|uniref:CRISPR type III-associated protein domain-containing protein n=2 Tax=Candidatus Marsarchaeota group 1 TaxID=2203770 RepID=A0A2R6A6D3_9ARCH|nr:MAG: hypothetical protein B9Q01_09540 [Candidatus Marsarchaeota G1 archaeon OSP_D]PSN85304.1 MAG: hypothetical protein B9Q00_11080 [Candidatus Marsarchaeota G1 archaeon OSP_C]
MNNIILKYTIELLSPTIISSDEHQKGMLYKSGSQIIPGSMVKGAIMSQLYLEKQIGLDKINVERENGSIRITPAVYSTDKRHSLYKEIKIAHALTYYFKKSKEVKSYPLNHLLNATSFIDELERILYESNKKLDQEALKLSEEYEMWLSSETKPAQGKVIEKRENSWVIIDAKRDVYLENEIHSNRKAAKPGKLYAYETIRQGEVFTGYVSIPENFRDIFRNELSVRIGRGIGRGFGHARITFEELKIQEKQLTQKRIPFVVIAPTFKLDPLPRPLRAGDKVGDIKIVCVITRIGEEVYRGWSYFTKSPKLPIRANALGTIFIGETETTKLENYAYMGFDYYGSSGFNIIAPLIEGE